MPIISNFPGGSAKKTLLQVIKDKIIPSKSEKTFNVEDGYDGFGNFVVGAIPDEYQDVTGVTATAEGTLAGTSFVNAYGEVVNGAMPNNDDVSATFDGIDKKSVDILPGYTTGGTIALTDDIDNEVSTQADFLAQIIEELKGKAAGGESTSHTLSMQKITVKESSYSNQDTEGELQTITISNVSKEPTFFALIRVNNGYLQSIDGARRYVLAVIYNKDGNPNGTYKIDYIYSLLSSSTRYTQTGYNANEDDANVRIIYDESNSKVKITAAYPYTLTSSDYYCYMLTGSTLSESESILSEFEQSLLGGAS